MSAAATLAGAAPNRVTSWHAINWRRVWRTVRRLQARIVKATQAGRWNKVQALVYLLTHSFAGRAAAIGRVIDNRGAWTPGVDGDVWDTPEAKASALVLASLPPAVMFMVYGASPDYIMPLFSTRTGNFMVGFSILWMIIGVLVMRKMINFKF